MPRPAKECNNNKNNVNNSNGNVNNSNGNVKNINNNKGNNNVNNQPKKATTTAKTIWPSLQASSAFKPSASEAG